MKIGIIIGSTRPGRNGEQVGQWELEAHLLAQEVDDLLQLLDATSA